MQSPFEARLVTIGYHFLAAVELSVNKVVKWGLFYCLCILLLCVFYLLICLLAKCDFTVLICKYK